MDSAEAFCLFQSWTPEKNKYKGPHKGTHMHWENPPTPNTLGVVVSCLMLRKTPMSPLLENICNGAHTQCECCYCYVKYPK